MPCRVRVTLGDGRALTADVADYPGFLTRGRTWAFVREKFDRLGAPYTTPELRDRIVATVSKLERLRVRELTSLLAAVRLPGAEAGRKSVGQRTREGD
jgi:2-methylcitrate dehydratase PrpD